MKSSTMPRLPSLTRKNLSLGHHIIELFNKYSPSYSNVLGFFYRAATVVQTSSKREKEEILFQRSPAWALLFSIVRLKDFLSKL